jgi:hypothetical protein
VAGEEAEVEATLRPRAEGVEGSGERG